MKRKLISQARLRRTQCLEPDKQRASCLTSQLKRKLISQARLKGPSVLSQTTKIKLSRQPVEEEANLTSQSKKDPVS